MTLLYPVAEKAQIDAGVLEAVAAIVARHPPLDLTLQEGRRYPDTLYASVDDPAWSSLPFACRVSDAELITERTGTWATPRQFGLRGGAPRS